MTKQRKTVPAHRLPPTKNFRFRDILDLNRRVGASVFVKYNPIKREFLVFTEDRQGQMVLAEILFAFPQQNIRL